MVWTKRKERYEKAVKEQVNELLKQIEAENEAEEAEYGERDLEEMGGRNEDVNGEQLKKKIAELNERLRDKLQKRENTSTRQALKKLESNCLPRLEKYEEQTKVLAGRNSYSKTDPDATCMRMKEDRGAERPWAKPAYNVQVGTEGQFIVGYSVHNKSSDPICLMEHLDGLKQLPKKVVADAAYGSEENYDYLQKHELENYVKYPTFYQDTHHYRNPRSFANTSFARIISSMTPKAISSFVRRKEIELLYTSKYKTANGYESERKHYECSECQDCPLKPQCTKAKGNRRIQVSFRLIEFRKQARENLTSDLGKELRAKRSVEVETVFGHIKHNMSFRRFHLRGLKKVNTEWGLVSIAHNMRKLAG